MITILLVDDQNLVQQGIKSLLDQDTELKVIGTVKDGRSAIKEIDRLRPDIVLLDIEMPGMDGITTTKYINHLSPKTKVVILSSHEEKKFVTQALVAGAKGYILKSSLMNDLKQAIVAVYNGYSQVESRLLAEVFNPNNIKTKIRKSSSQIREVNNQDDNEIKLADKEITNAQNSSTISNPSSSMLLDRTNPETTKTNSLLLEQETLPNDKLDAALLEEDNLQADQSLLLEQETLKDDGESLDMPRHQERSPSFDHQSDLTPISEHPLHKYKPLKPNRSRLVAKTSMVLNYVQQLVNKQKLSEYKTKILRHYQISISKHEPQISQYKSRLSQYKNSLLLLVNRWGKKGWLWNIGFVILGTIIVLILHNL